MRFAAWRFGEILNNISGSSTSFKYTRTALLEIYMRQTLKGWVFTIDGEFVTLNLKYLASFIGASDNEGARPSIVYILKKILVMSY